MVALLVNNWRMRRRTKQTPARAIANAGDGTLLKRCTNDASCYVPPT